MLLHRQTDMKNQWRAPICVARSGLPQLDSLSQSIDKVSVYYWKLDKLHIDARHMDYCMSVSIVQVLAICQKFCVENSSEEHQ